MDSITIGMMRHKLTGIYLDVNKSKDQVTDKDILRAYDEINDACQIMLKSMDEIIRYAPSELSDLYLITVDTYNAAKGLLENEP